jgi:RecA-family ATPase
MSIADRLISPESNIGAFYPSPSSSSSGGARPGFVGIDQYLSLPRESETWLLKPLIPQGGACLIYGAPKLGKSYLAIQLALALSGQYPDFLGFPVLSPGRILYLQLDTPRSVWADRFDQMLKKGGLKHDSQKLLLADRDSIEYHPFDVIQPAHMKYLRSIIEPHNPSAVIIDTIREAHSGDEDSSQAMRNVVANLVAACHPAALILVSHSRKSHPEGNSDLMDDHRGSSYVTGRMDAIMRLTKRHLYYQGRSIEAGDITVQRLDNGLWQPQEDTISPAVNEVMADTKLTTISEKAKVLAAKIGKGEEAARSLLRRRTAQVKECTLINQGGDLIDIDTGEVIHV